MMPLLAQNDAIAIQLALREVSHGLMGSNMSPIGWIGGPIGSFSRAEDCNHFRSTALGTKICILEIFPQVKMLISFFLVIFFKISYMLFVLYIGLIILSSPYILLMLRIRG